MFRILVLILFLFIDVLSGSPNLIEIPNEEERNDGLLKQLAPYFYGTVLVSGSINDEVMQLDYPVHVYNENYINSINYTTYVLYLRKIHKLDFYITAFTEANRFHCNALYIVVIQREDWLRQIMEKLWNSNVYKIMVVTGNNLHTVDLDKFTCSTNIPVKTISCSEFGNYKFVFKNCALNLSWEVRPPYAINPYLKDNPGFVLSIAKTVTEYYDLKQVYNPPSQHSKEFYRTGSARFLQREFESGLSDMDVSGFGSFLAFYNIFQQTDMILYDSSWILIPKPDEIEVWKRFLFIFHTWVWMLVVFVMFLLSVLFYFTNNCKDFVKSFLYVIQITLVTSIELKNVCMKPKFLVFILAYAFIMNIYVQGRLFSLITVPLYEKHVTSIEGVIESKYPKIMPYGAYAIIKFTYPEFAKVKYTISNNTLEEDTYNFFKYSSFITFGKDVFLSLYSSYKYDKIFTSGSFSGMNVRDCFHMLDQTNWVLRVLQQAGLVKYWKESLSWAYGLKNNATHSDISYRSLDLHSLANAFAVWILGIGVSGVAFLLEIFKHKFDA